MSRVQLWHKGKLVSVSIRANETPGEALRRLLRERDREANEATIRDVLDRP